jgi:hypothetical protein
VRREVELSGEETKAFLHLLRGCTVAEGKHESIGLSLTLCPFCCSREVDWHRQMIYAWPAPIRPSQLQSPHVQSPRMGKSRDNPSILDWH